MDLLYEVKKYAVIDDSGFDPFVEGFFDTLNEAIDYCKMLKEKKTGYCGHHVVLSEELEDEPLDLNYLY